ncbi:MAG: hypothetical protein WAT56_03195, partial [Candidatus Microthrix parvicella]
LDGARRTADAWTTAGTAVRPKFKVACFASLGHDAAATLASFTAAYLAVFGRRFSSATAEATQLHDDSVLRERIEALAATGAVDEVILVPATTDIGCATSMAELVDAANLTMPAKAVPSDP